MARPIERFDMLQHAAQSVGIGPARKPPAAVKATDAAHNDRSRIIERHVRTALDLLASIPTQYERGAYDAADAAWFDAQVRLHQARKMLDEAIVRERGERPELRACEGCGKLASRCECPADIEYWDVPRLRDRSADCRAS